jgi:alpha-glucosidase
VPSLNAANDVPWWRDSVVYQLYLRSFADSDGDGIGDFDGITEHLDHLASLGVDAVWLNPCYPSPNRDGGYDVTDFTTVDGVYGGMVAFNRMLDAAHARGLRVLMDLVPNHCSSAHPWFQEALRSAPDSLARSRFHFRDGRGPGGAEPPNNWRSTFGGPAWTRVVGADGAPEQWYLHSFDASQPDFNWSSPDVGDMFADVLERWFDRGVDGFRIDVAYAMVKREGLPDADDPMNNPHMWNQPGVYDIFKRWRSIADSHDRDLTLVGEVWLPHAEVANYIAPGRLNQVFFFDLLLQSWDAASFRAAIEGTLSTLPGNGGVPTWALNNHDVHRMVTRYGLVSADPIVTDDANARLTRRRGTVDVDLGVRRARAATLQVLALPGSVYLYQGEELGLPEVLDLPDDARRDPIWQRSGGVEHGRDGSRVPLPWTPDPPTFGFSADSYAAPWLPQPDWYGKYAVSLQDADPTSTLAMYRAALSLRRSLFAGPLEWLDTGRADVRAFRRGRGLCVANFGDSDYRPPTEWGEVVLSSRQPSTSDVAGCVTYWLRDRNAAPRALRPCGSGAFDTNGW